MKNKKLLFFIIVIVCLILIVTEIFFIKSSGNLINGPGNIEYISAEIVRINDISDFEVTVINGNNDFKIGDKVLIKNAKSCYERIDDKLIEINYLTEGDKVIVMYFDNENNVITSVRAIEKIG